MSLLVASNEDEVTKRTNFDDLINEFSEICRKESENLPINQY